MLRRGVVNWSKSAFEKILAPRSIQMDSARSLLITDHCILSRCEPSPIRSMSIKSRPTDLNRWKPHRGQPRHTVVSRKFHHPRLSVTSKYTRSQALDVFHTLPMHRWTHTETVINFIPLFFPFGPNATVPRARSAWSSCTKSRSLRGNSAEFFRSGRNSIVQGFLEGKFVAFSTDQRHRERTAREEVPQHDSL